MRTVLLLPLILAGCTTVLPGKDSQQHISLVPAVHLCLLASCNATFADRAERAGGDGTSTTTTGDAKLDATNETRIKLPGVK